jgi:hypothetical protein
MKTELVKIDAEQKFENLVKVKVGCFGIGCIAQYF